MSVQQKILLACVGFGVILASLGLLARQQTQQLGNLVMGIYDHSLIGITDVNDAQAQFLRLTSGVDDFTPFATPGQHAGLDDVLERMDIAIERASTERTRAAGGEVREMLVGLPEIPPYRLPERIAQVDRAIATLVGYYSADGLQARDEAEEVVERGEWRVLAAVTLSFGLAICFAWLLSRNLSPPLIALVRVIGRLTQGDLEQEVASKLSRRRDEIGALARATSFFRETMLKNITAGEERRKLEVEGAAARLHAEQSREEIVAKSDFLATMSHEIRTPMNGVATVADLLAETSLSADQLKMVNIIAQSSKWLIRVINDILDFSKLEAQQLHIEHVPFMLDEVVASSCQVLAAKAREKGLLLIVEGHDLPGACRIGDPLRVRQILLNLLGNAIKFTAGGSVRLVLSAAHDEFTLSVIDTGIGIAADQINRLFVPYNQLRSDIARSYGGTGLGLTITKNLVSLMGGELIVTSEVEQGSRFTVRLALPSDVSTRCKTTNQPVDTDIRWQKPAMAVAAEHGAVVLCAEDNIINREVLARVLDRLGFNYDMAEDGRVALDLLDRRRHGVVLTDAQMPVLDGWHLAQAIRQQEDSEPIARLPIILLTADAVSEHDGRMSSVGIDTVLTKPLDRGQLEATLLGAVAALGALRVAYAEPEPVHPSPGAAARTATMDLDVLVQLVGSDPEDITALLDEFQASVTREHDQLRAALVLDDASGLRSHVHSMKGAARYAGATQLAEICDRLEQQATQGAALQALSDDLATLDAAVERLPAEVTAAIGRLREAAAPRY
jgi:signal transduction histidine kinase/CheY-like chemotaxis protein